MQGRAAPRSRSSRPAFEVEPPFVPVERARRRDVPVDEPLAVPAYDYADAFEIGSHGDRRTAEQWLRAGLEGSPVALRRLIRLVHGGVLRFRLGPPSPDHILGWKVVMSTPEVVLATAEGPLGRGVLVGRRGAGTV